jgi:hydrogenase expression/formation protein HypE
MKEFSNIILNERKDSAVFKIGIESLAFTTDSYVVNPAFFPGGDIGSLADYGTVNDLAVCGAMPLFISLGLIIEEGFSLNELKRIARSIASAARKAGVSVVTGDTKVVEKGSCDGIFINTSGLGRICYEGLSIDNIKRGDKIIVSGTIGEHAISVLSGREGIDFETSVRSDSAPLGEIIRKVLEASDKVSFMRDPTRGGLAATLNEIAQDRDFGIALDERRLPVSRAVRGACELLGLDPIYLACEGRFLLVVAKEHAAKVIGTMRRHRLGARAAIIGEVVREYPGRVYIKTLSGGARIVDMPSGEQLPRIC